MLNVFANWPIQPEEKEIVASHWPAGLDITFSPGLDATALMAAAGKADVIVGFASAAMLESATRLRYVQVLGHGIDRLGDTDAAAILRARKIPISRANPAAITLSEFVIMAMIALTRRIIPIHEALAHRGDWSQSLLAGRLRGSMGGELFGSTLTIAGLGSIGQHIAARAKAFGMRVGALTRTPAKYDAKALGLDYIGSLDAPERWLAATDHLVLALPLNADTTGFLSAARFAALKPGSYLINIARAPMVDQAAQYEALRSGHLAGAAIDVWPDETVKTVFPSAYPIHTFNVLMTPHSSAITRESRVRALTAAGENLRRTLAGEPLLNVAGIDD